MDYWRTIYRFSWMLLALLAVIGIVCIFAPKCHNITSLQNTKATLERQNREKELGIAEVKTKRDRFTSDPAFVERTARDIGMIKPGEVMYKFTNANARESSTGANP